MKVTVIVVITGSHSNNPGDDNYILEKTGSYKEIEMIFYSDEFEYLLYGFNYCFDYVNAISELQDCSDNFFFQAKALSVDLMHLLQKNIKSRENITVRLDITSIENLAAASDLILYMTMTQLGNRTCCHEYSENSIRKCHDTFIAIKERLDSIVQAI